MIQQCAVSFVAVLLSIMLYGSGKAASALVYGQVSGRVMTTSGPPGAGTLAFFLADQGSDPGDPSIQRIPERTAFVNDQGYFAVDIQYGRYHLGYFPGKQKTHPGRPEKDAGMVFATAGDSKKYILHVMNPATSAGDINFLPLEEAGSISSFTIEGVVRNKSGKPVAGITIIAKTDRNAFRPQYMSRQTDKSGRYTLTVPPGSYYLFARHRLEKFGRPAIGEYFGIWGVDGPAGEFGWFPVKQDTSIVMSGEAGQTTKGADIIVFRIPDPAIQEQNLRSEGKR